jgi:hypothetical protein
MVRTWGIRRRVRGSECPARADPWRALAAGIVLQALADARRPGEFCAEARAWLQAADTEDLVAALDVDPSRLAAFLAGLDPLSADMGGVSAAEQGD